MPFVAKGYWACQSDWGLSVNGLLLSPSAPGRFASLEPMMGRA